MYKNNINFEKKTLGDYSEVLTVPEVQSILGIGRNMAYRLIDGGYIRHIRIGRAIRVPKKCLLEYLDGADYNVDDKCTSCNEGGDII